MGMTVRDTTMLYLSQMMGKPVVDTQGEKIGTISDLAISTGEVFPRITSLAFQGPGKVPFMISWRKYVDTFDEDGITLNAGQATLVREMATSGARLQLAIAPAGSVIQRPPIWVTPRANSASGRQPALGPSSAR